LGGIVAYGSAGSVIGMRGMGGFKSTDTHNGHAIVQRPPPAGKARNPAKRLAPA
jgi:hypothetical protein